MIARRYLLPCLFALPFALAAENLLPNGGFEEGLAPWRPSFAAECVQVVEGNAHTGTGSLQVTCRNQIAGVDSPRFRLGEDIARRGVYRLRAALRNGGIETGDFGLRLYFYSETGEHLAMHSGITVQGNQAGEWQVGEITFGRGTSRPIPPAAATMMVRFSLWAPEPGATGTAWLDSVSLEQLEGDPVVQRGPLAWIWQEADLPAPPANLAAAIRAGGFAVQMKTSAELAAPNALSAENLDLLVLPHSGLYPVELARLLPGFCLGGGALLTYGGAPFQQPVYRTAAGARELAAAGAEVAQLPPGPGWTEALRGPEDKVVATVQDDAVRVSLTVNSYAYVSTNLPPLAVPDAVFEFEARGDEATPRVCLEFHEQDGSRWKRIIPLTPTWTTHRLHLAEFAAYASQGRGDDGDHLHPERIALFMAGMTKGMTGTGERRFEFRNLRFRQAELPSALVAGTPRFVSRNLSAVRWFGPEHTREPWLVPSPDSVVGDETTCSRLRRVVDRQEAESVWQVWEVGDWAPPPKARPGVRRLPLERVLAEQNAAVSVPLLEAVSPTGESLTCAVLTQHRDGPYAGSRWGTFALAGSGELAPLVARTIEETAQALAASIWLQGPRPSFRVHDGHILLDVDLPVANPSPQAATLTVALRIGQNPPILRDIALPPRQAAAKIERLAEGIPAPALETEGLELTVEIRAASGPVFGPRQFVLDLPGQLRAISDFMVAEAADDAKLHGYSFIDNRGMRALLGAYEILGDRRYLDTALRWGEAMVAEQREDGGYRMGYGITRKGEECYVADGGEIVVGVLRLASYSEGEQRERFLASADRYMAYREDFRVPTGGIGVGWCLQDYGSRPIVPLDTPTRIYAPETNTYTIGCSLAGAYGHAAIRGGTDLERRAEIDADWLMPRAKRLNGAFIESYFFAHAFATSAERRQLYADYIDQVFLSPTLETPTAWWLAGGGRHALNLDGLAYCLHRLEAGPETRAEIYRALCAMYSPQAPHSIPNVIAQSEFDHDRWIYICFGTLGLVDLLKPMVSIDGWR